MDIEQFYEADERRRHSAEIELGTEWRDAAGVRYELSWVEDTGELYVMREPIPPVYEDPFGDFAIDREPISDFAVHVVARIETQEQVEQVLDGWQKAMAGPVGVEWLADRLRSSGAARLAPPG